MDWTELRRASRREAARDEPDSARLALMRQAMDRRIDETERSARPAPPSNRTVGRPRRGMLGLALGGACTVLLIVVLVAAPASGGASAEAAVVLDRAAVHAGQARPTARATVLSIRERGVENVLGAAEAAISYESRTLLRVPGGDGSGTWIRKSWTVARSYAYGDRAEAASFLHERRATEAHPRIETATDGAFVNNPPSRRAASFGDYPGAFRTLPRDPSRLLSALQRASAVYGPSSPDGVLSAASQVLTSGAADGSLQAAVFEALRRQSGLGVVEGRAKDLDGRIGVGIGVSGDRSRTDPRVVLIIDPGSGAFLGERVYEPQDPDGVIPAGTLVTATAVRGDLATDCCGAWRPAKGDVAFHYP